MNFTYDTAILTPVTSSHQCMGVCFAGRNTASDPEAPFTTQIGRVDLFQTSLLVIQGGPIQLCFVARVDSPPL